MSISKWNKENNNNNKNTIAQEDLLWDIQSWITASKWFLQIIMWFDESKTRSQSIWMIGYVEWSLSVVNCRLNVHYVYLPKKWDWLLGFHHNIVFLTFWYRFCFLCRFHFLCLWPYNEFLFLFLLALLILHFLANNDWFF